MSGVRPPNDPQPLMSETPLALADLARLLEGEGPSPHVERALDVAWEAMHAATAREARSRRRSWPGWTMPALAAAAVLVVSAAWVGWVTSARGGPDAPEPVGVHAAVPGGPFEPPPSTVPDETRASVRPDQRGDPPASSRPAVRSPRAPYARPDAAVRTGDRGVQSALAEDPEPFIWLRGADEIEPGLGVHVVRVQVPRLLWDAGTPRRELVDADVLMGSDGQARAVRVVRTGSR